MNVFLDTEFTDLLDPILISLGMVTERSDTRPTKFAAGEAGDYIFMEEFYIEVPYPGEKCTPFVREAVLPQLGQDPNAFCELDKVRLRILQWLEIVRRDDEEVHICVDYQTDWDLFIDLLDYRVPSWCTVKMVGRDINELLIYEFFKKSGLRDHHALNDARANQYSYRPRREP